MYTVHAHAHYIELTSTCILHDQVKCLLCLYHLKQFHCTGTCRMCTQVQVLIDKMYNYMYMYTDSCKVGIGSTTTL